MRIALPIVLLLLAGCVGSPKTIRLSDAASFADGCCGDVSNPTADLSQTNDGVAPGDTSDTTQCFGNRVISCSGDSNCVMVADCPHGCANADCKPLSCEPAMPSCSANLAGTCSTSGTSVENSVDCADRRCSGGQCCNTPTAIHLGQSHLCAQFADNSISCWGDNSVGQLGNGDIGETITSPTPGLTALNGASLRSLALGDSHTCVVLTDGTVECVGANSDGQLGRGSKSDYSPAWARVIELKSPMKLVAAGTRHSCAVSESGAVLCWGYNYSGQLGSGNYENTEKPVSVVGLDAPVKKLAMSFDNTCAITEAGALYCWGKNNYGQLGIGTTGAPNKATLVTSVVGNVVDVGIAADHMCIINHIGEVYCAGRNRNGQLGNGTDDDSKTLKRVNVLDEPSVALHTGSAFTCAVTSSGKVACWGINDGGMLGLGDDSETRHKPTLVDGILEPAVALIGSRFTTCALTLEHLYCFGLSGDDRWLGTADTPYQRTPAPIANLFDCSAPGG